VFALETPLPFSISDRRKRSESEPLEAFLKILALQGSRLEKTLVLDLLVSKSIAGKFKISLDDLTKIEQMADDANILWGRDGEHRKSLGFEASAENTWQFGLNRLFMGMAMPEGYDGLVRGILPCESFEGSDLETLGKLAAFCHALFSGLAGLEGEKPLAAWTRVLRHLARSLLDENPETAEDLFFLMETLDELESGAKKAGFEDSVSFDLVHSLLAQKLDLNISQGNFMSGNITFCNILPMRSIPFKIVVLMGMDETAFPKKVFSPGFNLMKKFPRPGDKNERNEDLRAELAGRFDAKTQEFVDYWFAPEAQIELLALLKQIEVLQEGGVRSFLELAFSSVIITKSGGVSLALDLAHTRPHRAKDKPYRSPIKEFEKRLKQNLTSLAALPAARPLVVLGCGDAQSLPLKSGSVDLVVTSPPYPANAIDYMRAHKFSLVWMGYPIDVLSQYRKRYIGSEALDGTKTEELPSTTAGVIQAVAARDRGKGAGLRRYYSEMARVLGEMIRVIRPGRAAIVVVGSSVIRGIDTRTYDCLAEIGQQVGFEIAHIGVRNLDRDRRMMPARRGQERNSQIENRMHREYVIGFYKPGGPQ